ncbi:OB-fold protein [Tessaracoccus sp. Y1736]
MSENVGDAKARAKAEKAYVKASRPWFKKKRYWALGVLALIVVVQMANGGADDANTVAAPASTSSAASAPSESEAAETNVASEPAASSEPAAVVEEAPIVVSAQELIEALESNALAASNQYKGKRVTVTGSLANVDASGDYFTLNGTDEYSFTNVQIFIDEEHLDTVSALTAGQDVTVTGTVSDVGELLGYSIQAETIS